MIEFSEIRVEPLTMFVMLEAAPLPPEPVVP